MEKQREKNEEIVSSFKTKPFPSKHLLHLYFEAQGEGNMAYWFVKAVWIYNQFWLSIDTYPVKLTWQGSKPSFHAHTNKRRFVVNWNITENWKNVCHMKFRINRPVWQEYFQ